MGGSAYLIFGSLGKSHLEPQPIKRNIIDKLLGRQRYRSPREYKAGNISIIDLVPGDLTLLKKDFIAFLHQKLPQPWKSTNNIFNYLDLDVTEILLRAEKNIDTGTNSCYVQLSFSGCAGMGEVSANVATHWASVWFKANRDVLEQEHFKPFGFIPKEPGPNDGPEPIFVPLSEGGYAQYYPEPQLKFIGDQKMHFHFDVDAATLESENDNGLSLMTQTENSFTSIMASGKCRCQFCSPEFIQSTE